MGAALTYARRYALFTLVGIAGEDDLDAPDLAIPASPSSGPNGASPTSGGSENRTPSPPSKLNGNGFQPPSRRANTSARNSAKPLSAEASQELAAGMIVELESLTTESELDKWAFRSWPKVNTLRLEDAERLREAFDARLAAVRTSMPAPGASEAGIESYPQTTDAAPEALALPKPLRRRDRHHLRFVAQQPCLICGRQPCDPHHLKFAQAHGFGQKVSDEFAVPLCRAHHSELHRAGTETDWWTRFGIDPLVVARSLWLNTRADGVCDA
jgi:hypothetical protein